ncbi:MAG TPA: hypothetical protein VFV00_03115 [Acidimicrobiales bacterium]|nr:hypothetical protein [Acidimicrobiales bacterium]
MLTIVQACRRSECDGRVRFTRRRWWLDNNLVGRCDVCGKKHKLHNGRPATAWAGAVQT